jgi:succinate dehydrogenase / fumarate reductase cytochrome b subunit
MRYQPRMGFTAWLLMRITGVGIVIYLPIHVWGLQKLLQGPEAFNQYIQLYSHPLFKLGEIALLGGIIFHALNGVRIMLVDFGTGWRQHKALFWAVAAAGAIIFITGVIPMIRSIL